jgi:hypothetical protein
MSRKKAQVPKTTTERAKAVLRAYAETANIQLACKMAGVGRATHYRWLREKPAYAKVFEKARLAAGDSIESIAVERATVGWLEPVHYQGAVCGHVRRYSDGLLMYLLRGFKPERYGVQRQEISGPQQAPVQGKIEIVFVKPKPYEPLADALPEENGPGMLRERAAFSG